MWATVMDEMVASIILGMIEFYLVREWGEFFGRF